MLKPILLVEDNPQDVELMLIALEKTHLTNEVVVARDGEEALDYLTYQGRFQNRPRCSPTVILLDLKLPKIDGLEVLERIRADADLHETTVVMLTSSREEKDLLRSYRLGVNAYVVKATAFEDFITSVQELGVFWASLNEAPPTTKPRSNNPQ